MGAELSVTFTGLEFRNPFLLSSAPPTESDSNIMRAFDAGWGGVVTKTIGLHPVINVKGPKTKFIRAAPGSYRLSMEKQPDAALHSSWNWELISDKTLDWWVPRLGRIKKAYPKHILVASIMAGSEDDRELEHWQALARACQDEGCDAFELNLSCPHMDRDDMGSNIGKNCELIETVVGVVKAVARVPVWVKLTPMVTDISVIARAVESAGADALCAVNTFVGMSIDLNQLKPRLSFRTGGLSGPAIRPLAVHLAHQAARAVGIPVVGIGGIMTAQDALEFLVAGCAAVQVGTATFVDPRAIAGVHDGIEAYLTSRGLTSLADLPRHLPRD